jgi:hypothetical protein
MRAHSLPRLVLISALALACSERAFAGTLEVGADKTYKFPSDAIKAAKNGDKILIARGEYFDCAVVTADDLVIEGTGADGSSVMTDKACGGKALLVTTGNNITIRNLTLTRVRVPDGNGAGIRAEGVGLTVEHVKFINDQSGILGGRGTMTIRDSEFQRNGGCANAAGCAHGIYANELDLLHIERTKFADTREGHHIKSRALRTEIIGCDIRDGETGTASYLIDIPNGGSLIVRDSTMEKGPKAENHSAAIVIGAEGVTHPTREIIIENNTFRNAGSYPTAFVKNLTATEAVVKHNTISGTVQALEGDGAVSN